MTTNAWQVEYGNGGWVRVTSSTFDGWLYLRVEVDQGRPVPIEFYYDPRGQAVTAAFLRGLPLARVMALIADGDLEGLKTRAEIRGPNLALLASHFASTFGKASHWVADSLRWDVRDPPEAKRTVGFSKVEAPAPLHAPDDGLTDAFLRSVAANHAWALRQGSKGPAVDLAKMAGVSPRTVHDWINKARDRGVMPRASQRKSS